MTSGHLGPDQPDKPWQRGLSLRDEPVLAREFLYNTVATVFEIDGALLAQPSRGRAQFALARQVAMYLAHVGCGLSLTAV